jgi:pyruvate dehydrogenase E2 component (dihydrolipoamide acetyltransferase)
MPLVRIDENISRNSNRYVPGPISCCVSTKADMQRALSLMHQLSEKHRERITLNALLIKAAAQVLRQYPVMLGVWEGPDLLRLPDGDVFDISGPIALQDSFTVFRIDCPCQKSVVEIAKLLNAQVAQIRRQQEVAGHSQEVLESQISRSRPCFILSNIGTAGDVDFAHATVAQFLTSRLVVCSLKKEPVVLADDRIEVRPMLPLVLDWDHRAMMGATAAAFLTDLKSFLENPSL